MKIFTKALLTCAALTALTLPQFTYADILRAEKYYLFSLNFDERSYSQPDSVKLIPCSIAQDTNLGNGNDSTYSVLDVTGKVVQRGTIVHPRVAYIESGDEPVGMLKTGRVDFKIPITAALSSFEFYEGKDQQSPSARVDFSQAEVVKAVCEPPLPKEDALR